MEQNTQTQTPPEQTGEQALLELNDLHTSFFTKAGVVRAVDGVSITIPAGKTVGLVGESGCGKSMTAMSIMGLVSRPGKITGGSILFHGEDLLALSPKARRQMCGDKLSIIFQEPMTSLNPVITVGAQVREAILTHRRDVSKAQAREQVLDLFRQVGIPDPERRYASYPHQLSGGLRQRICIAMAMVLHPEFLIADEPTTALDVTVEAQILALMKQLQRSREMSILMITHNLGVVADICDEVNVMYAGQIVEYADKTELFRNARHPYTRGLMKAIPRVRSEIKGDLFTIEGTVPNFSDMPAGCRFCDRCPYADEQCRTREPQLRDIGGGHLVRCFREVET